MSVFCLRNVTCLSLAVLAALTLSSCFTGIENTKKIELSRKDRRQITRTSEEKFMEDLEGIPLKEWEIGRRFLIADNRVGLLLENSGDSFSDTVSGLVGTNLRYAGKEGKIRPDRTEELIILLEDSIRSYKLRTGMDMAKADSALLSTRLPMIIDLETVANVKERLAGKTLWTRTRLWYDEKGDKISGRKYVPVTVTDVLPGTQLFPVKILFSDENGEPGMILMNYTSGVSDSRRFSVLFSLSEPRMNYPNVSDEVWRLICRGEVAVGMTKEECRLSLGNPQDVDAGHTHSETLDIWQYPDGTFLRFADGRLESFRK